MGQIIDYTQGQKPDSAYRQWVKEWTPPKDIVRALPGWVLLEFSPFGHSGDVWTPERVSCNAMVIHDGFQDRPNREGYLPLGLEVIYSGTEGTIIERDGRSFTRVQRKNIELMVPEKK